MLSVSGYNPSHTLKEQSDQNNGLRILKKHHCFEELTGRIRPVQFRRKGGKSIYVNLRSSEDSRGLSGYGVRFY